MRIVVLTNKFSLFGEKILNGLLKRCIACDVILIRHPVMHYWRLFNNVQKRVGFFDALYFSLQRFSVAPYLNAFEGKLPIQCTGIEDAPRLLKGTDLLILGQVGIVKKDILQVPKIGTLNAHTGMLPYYRGIDCGKWAIYNNEFDKIGASIHWVDCKVDTGNLISTQQYHGKLNFDTLEQDLYDLAISLLVETVSSIIKGRIPQGEKQGIGKQYYKMPRRLEVVVKNKLTTIY